MPSLCPAGKRCRLKTGRVADVAVMQVRHNQFSDSLRVDSERVQQIGG